MGGKQITLAHVYGPSSTPSLCSVSSLVLPFFWAARLWRIFSAAAAFPSSPMCEEYKGGNKVPLLKASPPPPFLWWESGAAREPGDDGRGLTAEGGKSESAVSTPLPPYCVQRLSIFPLLIPRLCPQGKNLGLFSQSFGQTF